jgi:tetratricopeptide (TPR) repeat protein
LAAAVLLMAAVLTGPARAADPDAALRSKLLALNEITGDDPIRGEILTLRSDPDAKKLLAVAVGMAKEKNQPFNYNSAYILAKTAQSAEDLEAGRLFFGICTKTALKLQSIMKLADAYEGLSLLLIQAKKYDESVQICKEFLELPADGPSGLQRVQSVMFRRLILALAKQGKVEEATKLVDRILDAKPDSWIALDLKGQIQREAGQNDDAAKTYEQVVEKVGKDKAVNDDERSELVEFYQYMLTGIYVDINRVDKAAGLLKALLAKHPNDPTYNNDLGYIWADHDQHLDEAEKLIRKALDEDRKQRKALADLKPEEDKDNAAYLDSLGWVLYKKKNYKEAKVYLLKATEDKDGQHIEILDHLGDVHLALGEKAQALTVWKKAVKVETSSRREALKKEQVEKKLKANQ